MFVGVQEQWAVQHTLLYAHCPCDIRLGIYYQRSSLSL